MISNYQGTVIKGSSILETSVANAEILPVDLRFYNLSFANTQECHVIVNNGDTIYLRGNQGLFIDVCFSIKIIESGINYNWTAVQA